MKTLNKYAFPVLLTLTCIAVHFWQHALASLPYLPLNGVVPLGILTPAILVLAFFTTFSLLKAAGTQKAVRRSLLSAAVMLAVFLAGGVYFLSYLSYRFAAVLPPLPVLPDWPTGIATLIVAAACITHLTGLMICWFVKRKTEKKRVIAAAAGWALLNACLFLITV